MEEPIRTSTRDLTRTLGEDLGILLENHFLGTNINVGPEMVSSTIKTDPNSVNWLKARKVIIENWVRCLCNTKQIVKKIYEQFWYHSYRSVYKRTVRCDQKGLPI